MNVEQAKELKNTILWEEFCKEVDRKVDYQKTLLLRCGPEELVSHQEMVKALESIKNIPDDVIDREAPASAT